METGVPISGGIHTMMSFVGSIGVLMANSGLAPILKSAFGGVEKMLSGKKFPQNMVERFMKEEHAMRHQPGLWNSIWSDMMIETTVMSYGHGPTGMKGIARNEKALDVWKLSLNINTQLEQDFLSLKDSFADTTVVAHKEEGRSGIKSDAVDRDNIRKSLENCLHPFRTSTHPKEIVNIYTGKLSDELVNVDVEQVSSFYKLLPGGFHEPLSKKIITMSSMKKTVKVGNVELADTSLIIHPVIALQLANKSIDAKEIFKYELDISIDKAKSQLKRLLAIEVSSRNSIRPKRIVLDGCAILWVVHWPSKGKVINFIKNLLSYLAEKLKICDVYLVFDRYYKYSTKSATRAFRAQGNGGTGITSSQ